MIGSSHRFHGHNSLRVVYQNGRTVRGPLVSLRFSQNPKRRDYRAAVVVSRKVHKSAVVRNRLRRRLYEALRARESQLHGGYDLALTVFSEQLADVPPAELQASVDDLLVRAHLIEQPAKSAAPHDIHAIVKAKESEPK